MSSPAMDETAQSKLTDFTVFRLLPTELRDKIWETAFCDLSETILTHAFRNSSHVMTTRTSRAPTPASDIALSCSEALGVYQRLCKSRYTRITLRDFLKNEKSFIVTPSTVLAFESPKLAVEFGQMLEPHASPAIRRLAIRDCLCMDDSEFGWGGGDSDSDGDGDFVFEGFDWSKLLEHYPGVRHMYLEDGMQLKNQVPGWRKHCSRSDGGSYKRCCAMMRKEVGFFMGDENDRNIESSVDHYFCRQKCDK